VLKDHAEVGPVTRAAMLSDGNRLSGYPDRYNQAFAFSAILYPAFRRHSWRLLSASSGEGRAYYVSRQSQDREGLALTPVALLSTT
jgi:hypothetical protein